MARFEYKTVNIDSPGGLEQGVRLLAAGWEIIRAGLCLVQFARPLPTKRSLNMKARRDRQCAFRRERPRCRYLRP